MTGTTLRMAEHFFDRPRVQKAVDRATRKTLSRAGAYVRRTARKSLKPAGKRAKKAKANGQRPGGRDPTVSRPGQPPKVHSRNPNLRLILFAWEATRKSVVVGPVKFSGRSGNVPQTLEHGGTGRVRRIRYRHGQRQTRMTTARYRPRPFMRPAMETEAANFPKLFRNSVKG